jgi:hypothetical protein
MRLLLAELPLRRGQVVRGLTNLERWLLLDADTPPTDKNLTQDELAAAEGMVRRGLCVWEEKPVPGYNRTSEYLTVLPLGRFAMKLDDAARGLMVAA